MPLEPATATMIGTALQGGASVAAGLFGKKKAYKYNSQLQAQQAEYNRQAQERAYEQNRALSEYQYDREMQQWERENQANIDFWNMQNAYNSPQAQMARYQGAGLNPNLIYGQSNTADQLTAASSPNYQATPMQAEQMSGGSGVGDDLRAGIGDPIQEFYKIKQMEQSLENARLQGKLIESQTNKNNMDALFGETRNEFLRSSQPYWKSNAEFDNVAKKIQNDINTANLSALIFQNDNLLPLKQKELELLNGLRSQNLDFYKDANPLRIKELTNNVSYMELRNSMLNTTLDWEKSLKDFVKSGDLTDSTIRRLLIYFLRGLAN